MKSVQPKDDVNVGVLYKGFTWEYAITDALDKFNAPIQPVFVSVSPSKILEDQTVFSHYALSIKDDGRKFTTKIPSSLNQYVFEQLQAVAQKPGATESQKHVARKIDFSQTRQQGISKKPQPKMGGM